MSHSIPGSGRGSRCRGRGRGARATLLIGTALAVAAGGCIDGAGPGSQRAASTAGGSLCATPSVCPGATALLAYNPTHYALQPDQTAVLQIINAVDAAVAPCGPSGEPGVPVWVKSSQFGNLEFCGALDQGTITVTVMVPASPAPGVSACSTTVVAYGALGNNSNNAIIAAVVGRTSGGSAAGLAMVDADGHVLDCEAPNPCAGVLCDDGNPCTADRCVDGACVFDPAPMEDTLCRLPVGVCDAPEYCLGGQCPADGFLPPTTQCRAAAGICDAPDFCTGASADCPADAKLPPTTLCRPGVSVCDQPEYCDGVSDECPADEMWPANKECTGDSDRCTRDVCDGAGHCIHPENLCVTKFYDGDANGERDRYHEPTIAGWQIVVTPVGGGDPTVFTTEANGTASIFMPPGTYDVCELTGGYLATVPVCFRVTFPADFPYVPDLTTHQFGNLCTGAGGGLTLGFWSNRNGQKLVGADDLAALAALNLRNANGSSFDPAGYSSLRSWLLNATATNMAYMLSAQLATMDLNVINGMVNPQALIYAPGTDSANALGFATVQAVIQEANEALGLAGLTLAGSPYRAHQTALKDALDQANNNRNFVQPTPASCPPPRF